MPERPWAMAQWWRDLLFAHWPVPVEVMRKLIPEGLEPDVYEGEAWVAVVPFRMTGVRPRGVPPVPWLSAFAELNVRTYVRPKGGGKPGVFFWSLEASNPVAVWAARTFFHLPYMNAEMRCEWKDGWVEYESVRTHRGEPAAELKGRYRPSGAAVRGPLVEWLTERYCLYTTDGAGRVYRGEIHHKPWPLEGAEAEFEVNTMAEAAGIILPERPPLLHFAREIQVAVWLLERVS